MAFAPRGVAGQGARAIGCWRNAGLPVSYSNAGAKPRHLAARGGTQRICGAISERGAAIC